MTDKGSYKTVTVVTPELLQKKCQKSVTVRGISEFSISEPYFFPKFDKNSEM